MAVVTRDTLRTIRGIYRNPDLSDGELWNVVADYQDGVELEMSAYLRPTFLDGGKPYAAFECGAHRAETRLASSA